MSSRIFCRASWPRISKKNSARLACSTSLSFSRSAALTCAPYCASRTSLRILPKKSGVQETSSGRVQAELSRPGLALELELLRLPEVLDRFQDRTGGHGRPVLGTRLANHGTRRHEILKEHFDVLVVDVKLLFKGIEFGIVEDLPPFAAQHGILGLATFQPSASWKLTGDSL